MSVLKASLDNSPLTVKYDEEEIKLSGIDAELVRKGRQFMLDLDEWDNRSHEHMFEVEEASDIKAWHEACRIARTAEEMPPYPTKDLNRRHAAVLAELHKIGLFQPNMIWETRPAEAVITRGLDELVIRGEVTLVGGASAAGKSTFMYQLMEAARTGQEFLGATAKEPLEYAIISVDRSAAGMAATARRLGLPAIMDRAVEYDGKFGVGLVPFLTKFLAGETSRPDVLIIEAADFTIPGGKISDLVVAGEYIKELGRFAKRAGVAILVTMGSPKHKVGEGYAAPRDNTIGTTAWSRLSETVIMIRRHNADKDDGIRQIDFMTRQTVDTRIFVKHIDGGRRWELTDEPTKVLAGGAAIQKGVGDDNASKMICVLDSLPANAIVTANMFPWLVRQTVYTHLRELANPPNARVGKDSNGRWVKLPGAISSNP